MSARSEAVSEVLVQDEILVNELRVLYNELGLLGSEFNRLKLQFLFGACDAKEYVNSVISKWTGNGLRTIGDLRVALRNSGFVFASELIMENWPSETPVIGDERASSLIWFSDSETVPTKFFGRSEQRNHLTRIFEDNASKSILLHGLPGIGKTTLALRVGLEQYKSGSANILYMNVSGIDLMTKSLESVLLENGVRRIDPNTNSSIEIARIMLNAILKMNSKKFLIIFDHQNAKSCEELKPILNHLNYQNCFTLILSRDSNALDNVFQDASSYDMYELTEFSKQDVVDIFGALQNLNMGQEIPSSHPIFIFKAVESIKQSRKTSFKGRSYGMNDFLGDGSASKILEICSFEALAGLVSSFPEAVKGVLYSFALLRDEKINFQLAKSIHTATMSEQEYYRCLKVLQGWSLIIVDEREIGISRFVGEGTRQTEKILGGMEGTKLVRMEEFKAKGENVRENVAGTSKSGFQGEYKIQQKDTSNLKSIVIGLHKALKNHKTFLPNGAMEQTLKLFEDNKEKGVLFNSGFFELAPILFFRLDQTGEDAVGFGQSVLNMFQGLTPLPLPVLEVKVRILMKEEKWGEALPLAKTSAEERKKLPDLEDILVSQFRVGVILNSMGQYDEPLRIYGEILPQFQSDSEMLYQVMYHMAGTYYNLKNWGEARRLWFEASFWFDANYAIENTQRLQAKRNIRSCCNLMKDWSGEKNLLLQMIKMQRETLAILKARFGLNHKRSIEVQVDLAVLLAEVGQNSEGFELIKEASAQPSFPEEHKRKAEIISLMRPMNAISDALLTLFGFNSR